MDIIEAKGAAALLQAESHLSGALSSFVRASRDQLKDLIAKLEVTIDYPEEDLEDLTNEEIEEGLSAIDHRFGACSLAPKRGASSAMVCARRSWAVRMQGNRAF